MLIFVSKVQSDVLNIQNMGIIYSEVKWTYAGIELLFYNTLSLVFLR